MTTYQETEKKILLEEFKKVAYQRVTPPFSSLNVLKYALGEWTCLSLTNLMQRLGYNQRQVAVFKAQREQIILNIGCLESAKEKYVNADLVPAGGIRSIFKILTGKIKLDYELLVNITFFDKSLSEFANGIILSHVLEHIHPQLAIKALENCFAYLKPGGCIRVTVPYLGAYEQPNFPAVQGVHNQMLAKNKLIYDYGHQFMYDAELLSLLMEEAGFSEVKEVTFKTGLLGETDAEWQQPESIYVTGIKPSSPDRGRS